MIEAETVIDNDFADGTVADNDFVDEFVLKEMLDQD
jgi:hypothetical protein